MSELTLWDAFWYHPGLSGIRAYTQEHDVKKVHPKLRQQVLEQIKHRDGFECYNEALSLLMLKEGK